MPDTTLVIVQLTFICLTNLVYLLYSFHLMQVDEETRDTALEGFLKISKQIIFHINTNDDCTCGYHNYPTIDCPLICTMNDLINSSKVNSILIFRLLQKVCLRLRVIATSRNH